MQNNLTEILSLAILKNASDIYLTGGQRSFLRIDGKMSPINETPLTDTDVEELLNNLIHDNQQKLLERYGAVDFSYSLDGRRFRGNAYRQRGKTAIVLRLLSDRIFSADEIGLSRVFPELLKLNSKLILVTGKVGSGKTTTMASFLEAVNKTKGGHIITLEDPIEYIYAPKKSFISQREYGVDFFDFAEALKQALREMPDIILVGEIRDRATMRTALMAAETGILVLGTLHTRSVAETALRVEGMFDKSEQDSIRFEFSESFAAIISQELIAGKNGGRIPLTEILLETPAAKNLIRQGKYKELSSVILSGQSRGMETKDAALDRLLREGKITREIFAKHKEVV